MRPATSLPLGWVPYTKLLAPQLGHNLLRRSRLEKQLVQLVRQHRLTLVAAPAGSGKTNLVASLTNSDLPTCWLALDEHDDDLDRFAMLLVSTLQPWLADNGQAIFAFLGSAPERPDKIALLAAQLINSFQPPVAGPVILILDDYHILTATAIHDLVTRFIEYLPPPLRLLIVTRHDPPLPLPRLRARGQLAELRLPELRFDEEETARFLNQQCELDLATADIAALQQRTSGWAAGLQLLANLLATLPGGAARTDYIRQLAPANRSIFDLLATEVLDRQPAALQEFLLQTATLPELTSANCLNLTGNANAAALLRDLYQRNLFLQAMLPDTRDGRFRYHDLFREFLQRWLRQERPQEWRDLHRRAAAGTTNSEQALYHLLTAELWQEAAGLLATMARLDNERRFTHHSVVKGIESLPEQIQDEHPWLLYFVAQYYAVRGQLERAAPWRARAANRFRETGDLLGEIELLVIRAMVDTFDSGGLIDEFRQKVATASQLMRPDHWAIYHGAEQWHGLATHDWASVTEHTKANIAHALQLGTPDLLSMTSLSLGPHMAFCDNGLALLERFAARALDEAREVDILLQSCARGLLGAVRFFQGRLGEAESISRLAHQQMIELGGLAWIDHHISWVILSSLLARSAYHGFDEFLSAQLARWQTQDTAVVYRQAFLYLQGRSYWLRGRTADAQAVLGEMEATSEPTAYEAEDQLRRLLLASLIAMSREETGAAKRHLNLAITQHDRIRHTVLLSQPRLTLATLYGQQNRWAEAMTELQQVLGELKVRQMPGVILQEGVSIVPVLQYAIKHDVEPALLRPLLSILQPRTTPQPLLVPQSDEHLTPREREVLQRLATGATNPAIAVELSVTERTVKAHVSRILAKLSVATRTEAVSRARQLGLI